MARQILTLDSLYKFFVEQNQTVNFSAKDSGKPIVVTTNGFFDANETDMPGMLMLELKVCHTDTNRNGSHISEDNMKNAMPTLKYRPILAYIHELEDGTKDFYAHNMEIVENEDGEAEINYIERQVGCFTADEPWLKYDEDKDKTYVHAYAVIPEVYTEAADIIRRKQGTKVSCELVINELSYNAKEKYLDLTDFYFGGCTLLGCDEHGNEIGEGMLGARADITEFCYKQPVFTYQDKMIEVLEKLNATLSNFNTNTQKEGGNEMTKFEELLAKYSVTIEDVTFEIEGLSDEELEAKFAEVFEVADPGVVSYEGDKIVEEGVVDPEGGEPNVGGEPEKFTKTFTLELSHDDIRSALYVLIKQYETEEEYYYIREVYDSYFVMQDWWNNKLYKQNYTVDGVDVALEGDRVEVFEILVTKEESEALDALKANYADLESKYNELKTFKDNYDAAEVAAQKDAILNREEYAILASNEDFVALKDTAEQYSVDEIAIKAKSIFADHVIKSGTFSMAKTEPVVNQPIAFNVNAVADVPGPYGDLFTEGK